jgi:hypothetical protein
MAGSHMETSRGRSLAGTSEANLGSVLEMLDPLTRDDLRRVLIRDQADRDASCKLYEWTQTFFGRGNR